MKPLTFKIDFYSLVPYWATVRKGKVWTSGLTKTFCSHKHCLAGHSLFILLLKCIQYFRWSKAEVLKVGPKANINPSISQTLTEYETILSIG